MRFMILLLLFIGIGNTDQLRPQEPRFRPEAGFVPDAATALKIAEAVLIPVYGEALTRSERPFKAVLEGDVWIITGTVPAKIPQARFAPVGRQK
jgi:hypothetical protein